MSLSTRRTAVSRARRVATIVFGIVLLGAWAASAASAQNRIYWTNVGTGTITFANLDGSGGFGTLTTTGATPSAPEGVAIDPANNKIYWANNTGSISFANLSGGGGGTLNTTGATLNAPFGIAIDPTHNRIYWANASATSTDGISFANLNESGGGNLNTGTATIANPIGVAIDPTAGKIYWANWNGGTAMAGKISFAFLDGSGGGDLATVGATVTAPEGVAIDPATNRIYWANQEGNKISFANLSGTGGGDVVTTGATVDDPSGVAIDAAAGKIYWANQSGGEISFANLNGSGGGDLNITGSTSTNASQPALLEQPLAVNPPVVTGGLVATSQLACTTGMWGPDLYRSLLYQAPASFSFTWLKDGSPVPGANTSSLTATSSGSYQCRLTATNFAGSTTQTSTAFQVAPSNSTNVSVTGSAAGATASLTVTCDGLAGQRCSGPIVITAHEKKKGKRIIGVTSSKRKSKSSVKQVTVASGSYSLPSGQTAKVHVTLNHAGKQLLIRFATLRATLGLPGTSSSPHVLTFRYARIQITHHALIWDVVSPSYTSASSLTIFPIPVGSTVQILCSGGGCPFSRHTVKARKRQVSVTKLFGSHHLRPGTTVRFTITDANHIGEVLTYALRALPVVPKPTIRCLDPGSKRSVKCG
jgi:DNA-binding beta-propeller fold protein YncE